MEMDGHDIDQLNGMILMEMVSEIQSSQGDISVQKIYGCKDDDGDGWSNEGDSFPDDQWSESGILMDYGDNNQELQS